MGRGVCAAAEVVALGRWLIVGARWVGVGVFAAAYGWFGCAMDEREMPILFYDSRCGLCDRTVRWCLDHDRRGVLRYAPIGGRVWDERSIGERLGWGDGEADSPETVVLFDSVGVHTRSEAALRTAGHLGGVWSVLGACGRVVPRVVRDAVYRFIARRRLRWFGGAEACRLASRAERERLLD